MVGTVSAEVQRQTWFSSWLPCPRPGPGGLSRPGALSLGRDMGGGRKLSPCLAHGRPLIAQLLPEHRPFAGRWGRRGETHEGSLCPLSSPAQGEPRCRGPSWARGQQHYLPGGGPQMCSVLT